MKGKGFNSYGDDKTHQVASPSQSPHGDARVQQRQTEIEFRQKGHVETAGGCHCNVRSRSVEEAKKKEMTKERMEVLNRHNRVLAAIRRGEDYAEIAQREGYRPRSISRIAVRNGIRVRRVNKTR
jgi:hypothetical protein